MSPFKLDRRSFLTGAASAAAGAAAVSTLGCAHIWVPKRDIRPNIIVLFSDDQRATALGCAGNPVIRTPNLDALAADGTYFSNSFVTTSICCVNRANIMTGQYARRHGVDDFFKQFSPDQFRALYPSILGAAGYETGFVGKWGIGNSIEATSMAAAVFDYWGGASHQTNFWHEEMCRYATADGWDLRTENTCNCPPDARGVDGPRVRIGRENMENPIHLETAIFPDKVDDFLTRRDPSSPFCLSLFYKSPHGPYQDFSDDVASYYDHERMPVPETATLELANARPEFLKQSLGGPTGMRYLENPEILQTHLRDYYRLISGMDLSIGRLRQQLEAAGIAENTVLIFTSDNGHFMGEQGYAGKWLMYEPSLRVPFMFHDPRRKASQRGVRCHEPVLTIDVAPTVLELAGLRPPESMQGQSILPLIDNPERRFRDRFFYEHTYNHGGQIAASEGVRDRRYKYIRYIDEDPVVEELYDLQTDPNELDNLYGRPGNEGLLQEMRAQHAAYVRDLA